MAILGHGEGEMGWLGLSGVAMDNYALEVAILGQGAPWEKNHRSR